MNPDKRHNLALHRTVQYVGLIAVFTVLGGGYLYWKSVQAGVTWNTVTGGTVAVSNSQETDVTSGLVGYWSFDGDDVAGTTAYDRSGSGNNGTLTNGPVVASGRSGQTLAFDGTDDYVDLASPAALGFTGATDDFTLTAWVRPEWAARSGIVRRGNATSGGQYIQYSMGTYTSQNLEFIIGNDTTTDTLVTGVGTVPSNSWSFVACSMSTSALTCHVNGKSVGSVARTINAAAFGTRTLIGAVTTTNYYFPGRIDEVRIYDRVLTSKELHLLYDVGMPDRVNAAASQGDTLQDGLAAYWKLDDASGTSAADASGNGYTGTLTNGPTWTTGQIGGGLQFDGTDDSISVGSIDLSSTDVASLSFWMNKSAFSHDDKLAFEMSANFNTSDVGFIVDPNSSNPCYDEIQIGHKGDVAFSYSIACYTQPSSGAWHHYVVIFDKRKTSSEVNLYIDGALLTATNRPFDSDNDNNFGTETLYMMSRAGTSLYNPGELDEVRIYNRELTQAEIDRLYRTTAPADPDSGLIGYWPFNGPDVAGTTAYDRSGKGNNGVLTSGPVVYPGKVGQGISFDGTDDVVSIADDAVLDFDTSQDFSISGWFRRESSSSDDTIVAKRSGTADTDDGYIIYIDDADDKIYFEVSESGGSDEYQVVSASTFTADDWHHIAVVWDDDSAAGTEIYVDGVADNGTDTGTIGNIGALGNALSLTLGSESDGGAPFDGVIDETRFFNRALSVGEIRAIYNASR